MKIRSLILMTMVALASMVLADDYVDDVYFWQSNRSETNTTTSTTMVTKPTRQVSDTIFEQPCDTVVKMIIRR